MIRQLPIAFAQAALGLALVAKLALATPLQAQAAGGAHALELTIQQIYQQRSDAVVRVKVATQSLDESGQSKTSLVVFSGFFISPDGRVLTNAIPKRESTRAWIEKDGLSYLADVVGSDERTNISLLQIINLPPRFAHISLGALEERPSIGTLAIAITSPLDFAPSPSFGLVTGYESHFANFVFPFTYTRVSIPIGPAEGGSPVFNARGQLLGISMASMPEVRSSYIIPVRALGRLVDDLGKRGSVQYGVLPIELEEKADRYNTSRGVAVKSVVAGSPAHRAGMREGDQILRIDGIKIESLNQARDIIFYKEPSTFMHFDVRRGDTKLEFAILLEPAEDHIAEDEGGSPRDKAGQG